MARTKALPGMEHAHDEELCAIAVTYQKAIAARQQKLDAEVECKTALMDAMATRQLTIYRDEESGLVVRIVDGKKNVKVDVEASGKTEPEESDDEPA